MFAYHGVRALWPVIFFLPWLLLGSAYLLEPVFHPRSRLVKLPASGIRRRTASPARRVGLIGFVGLGLLLILIVAPLALADPVTEGQAPCAATREEARKLGDVLFEKGAYQRAGECYQAAGEYGLANRAFVKAVGPQSAVTASQLSAQRDQAKSVLRKVEWAFHAEH
jgi:hypothetical protein